MRKHELKNYSQVQLCDASVQPRLERASTVDVGVSPEQSGQRDLVLLAALTDSVDC